MSKSLRTLWDQTCDSVDEIYPLDLLVGNQHFTKSLPYDLAGSSVVLTRLGIGHCTTKPAAGGLVSPREQLTLCGINESPNVGGVIWGYECPSSMNNLFPSGLQTLTRAKSHVFAASIERTKDGEGFVVEYVIQLEIGGRIPTWTTAPMVTQTIKNLFKFTHGYFGEGGEGRGGEGEGREEGGVEERMEELLRDKIMGGKEDLLVTM